jgi:predicted RNA polymerase sigma factor
VELAFIAALQHLPARERAVHVLREILGFSAREVAETLETTVTSVSSALQRARQAVDERLPEQSQQETLRSSAGIAFASSWAGSSTRSREVTSTSFSTCSPRMRRSRCPHANERGAS